MVGVWEDDKDEDEVLDFQINWGDRLDVGETILTSEWEISGDGALVEDTNLISDTNTVVWLSAGTDGENYLLTNRITTSGGRTYDQTVRLRCRTK